MRRFAVLSLIGSLLGFAGGCQQDTLRYQQCGPFDSCITLHIRHSDSSLARRAADTAMRDLTAMDNNTHPLRSNGMRRMNALLRSQEWHSANPSLYLLVKHARELYQASEGRYNPAIMGELLSLWGFTTDNTPKVPPSDTAINQILARRARMSDIEIDGLRLRSRNPNVMLHFGMLRRGQAIDIGIEYLRSVGIEHALLRVGDSARAIGSNGHQPWRVDYPELVRGESKTISVPADMAVCALSAETHAYSYRGKSYYPILDPRDGKPARGSRAIILLHDNAVWATAACNALFIAGAQDWQRLGQKMGARHVLLWDMNGELHRSEKMHELLHSPLQKNE